MTLPASQPLDTLQRMELAEGVEVELRPAGPMVRALAWLIDFLWMVLLVLVLWLIEVILKMSAGFGIGEGTTAILWFGIYWGYHVYFEGGRRAATPGKRSMGLRVVSESGGPAPRGAVMLRNLARTADFMPFFYLTGLLVCLFTKRFQRLGDIVARTLVVYNDPHTAHSTHAGPPPLPGRTPHPPPVALTREERAAVVRFHERATLWSAARREELAAHASGLTRSEASGVQELSLMAVWLRDS